MLLAGCLKLHDGCVLLGLCDSRRVTAALYAPMGTSYQLHNVAAKLSQEYWLDEEVPKFTKERGSPSSHFLFHP